MAAIQRVVVLNQRRTRINLISNFCPFDTMSEADFNYSNKFPLVVMNAIFINVAFYS